MEMILTYIPSSEYYCHNQYSPYYNRIIFNWFYIRKYSFSICYYTCITRIYIRVCASIWDFYIMNPYYYYRIWYRMMARGSRLYLYDTHRAYHRSVLSQSKNRICIRTLPCLYYFCYTSFSRTLFLTDRTPYRYTYSYYTHRSPRRCRSLHR